jgi:GNAT superfamily N-acetyltransferase
MDVGFDFIPMEPLESDLVRFRDCFVRNHSAKQVSALSWMYLENGSKQLLVTFAVHRHETVPGYLAGIYAVLPVRFRVDETVIEAAQSLNTMTDHKYQKRGLFVALASDVYARCRAASIAFVYGFPNGSSAHGCFKRLEWKPLDPVPFLIKPLRARYFLKRMPILKHIASILPDLPLRWSLGLGARNQEIELRPIATFDSDTDTVWKAFSTGVRVGLERDAAYLNWRFSKPGEDYQTIGAYDGSGRLRGFVVWTAKAKHGGRIGYIMELLFDPGAPTIGQLLIREANDRLVRAGCDVVLAWCFDHSPNFGAYLGGSFFKMPERYRPIELHFGVRVLADKLGDVLSDRKNWYISYADSDTV